MALQYAVDFRTISSLSGTNIVLERSTSATYFDPATGYLATAAANVPRFASRAYGDTTQAGLLTEAERYNYTKYCRDFTQSAWTKSNMGTSKTITGIDNAANTATQLTANAANATVYQTYTATADTRTMSVFLKRISGSGNVQISVNGSTYTTVTLTTTWQRFKLAATAANPCVMIRIVTSGDVIAADYAQIEDETQATSPIYTTTAAVWKDRDSCYNISDLGSVFNTTQGTFVFSFIHEGDPMPLTWPWIGLITNNNNYSTWMGFYTDNNVSATKGKAYTGGTERFDGLGWTDVDGDTQINAVMGYSSGYWPGAINNNYLDYYDGAVVPDACDTIIFGDGDSASSGWNVSFAYYDTLLSDADILTLSSTGYVEPSSGYTLEAGAGAFGLTGVAAGMLYGRKLAAGAGSFVLTGQAAGLLAARKLSAGAGSFTLTGQDADLHVGRKLSAGAGTFILTGIAADLQKSALSVLCETGEFSLVGKAAGLLVARKLLAEAGAFTLSGKAASLLVSRKVQAEAGAYTLAGKSAGLLASRVLPAGVGSFVLTGIDAELLCGKHSGITAEPGDFVLSGQAVGLFAHRRLSAACGGFLLEGNPVAFSLRHPVSWDLIPCYGSDVALGYFILGKSDIAELYKTVYCGDERAYPFTCLYMERDVGDFVLGDGEIRELYTPREGNEMKTEFFQREGIVPVGDGMLADVSEDRTQYNHGYGG